MSDSEMTDLFIIGGGINGCGIARDAVGRGLSVALAEMGDLASATSSASTKLFHGGLRYLEYFEVRLVREALIEREVLLQAMPHISWPMRFVLPYHRDMRFESSTPTSRLLTRVMPWMKGRRPAWLIRLGLFMYDHLGGRKILPGTATLDLTKLPEGRPLQKRFQKAYEYSDCWIEDARLVVLNARDAEARGARIMVRTKVIAAERLADHWVITTQTADGATQTHKAKMIVNAAGPWVGDVIKSKIHLKTKENVRLVRGSHIVTRRLFDHDKCYFFQGTDGRINFAIPYETDFTLIGTTDADHVDAATRPVCTDKERDYLIAFINKYIQDPIGPSDVVWSYSGVRPLYDDGAASASAATRDYVLTLDREAAPVLNIFGGKITTYRKLAESALEKIATVFPGVQPDWTAGVTLPGGDFRVQDFDAMVARLAAEHGYLPSGLARRLVRAYGTEAWQVLAGARRLADLGRDFGAGLYEVEVRWQMAREYALRAEDVVWRRTKLGLRLTPDQIEALDLWMLSEAQQAQVEEEITA